MSEFAEGGTATRSADVRADVLIEALPYIRRFFGCTVVIKLGGNAMGDPDVAAQFAADIVLLHSVGIKPVVVHGGGPQIGALLDRLGVATEFRDGLRITDAETLDVARMVLGGKVNREIVSAINAHDRLAVGISGEDAGMIIAEPRDPELGFVGDVVRVNPEILTSLIGASFVPVVSTIASDGRGQAYNINADSVAVAIAGALEAEKLIYLSDVPGILIDIDDPESRLSRLSAAELRVLVADGIVAGGMIPKVEACLEAVDRHVRSAHILDGRIPHAVLLELLTDDAGAGTMITRNEVGG